MKNSKLISRPLSQPNILQKAKRTFCLSLFLFCVFLTVHAAPTTPDSTFGNAGTVVSSPDGSETVFGNDMALQTDGKIVMVGAGSANPGFLVARYNANGSLDTTFGNNGWVSAAFENFSSGANAVDIQADGKIVVAGDKIMQNGTGFIREFGVVRFNSDGTLDTTFDGDGKASISFMPDLISTFHFTALSKVKVLSDGKIVIAGYASDSLSFTRKFLLAKLNADGSTDSNFGTTGRILDTSPNAFLYDMVVLPDDSVVVAATHSLQNSAAIAVKYDTTGGKVWTYSEAFMSPTSHGFYGIAAQPDGKLILVGRRNFNITAVRLNSNGSLDNTFASPFSLPGGDARSAAVQPDGKIVANYLPSAAGSDPANSFNLLRLNPSGSLDSGFGTNGLLSARPTPFENNSRKIIIQPDGKILIGGYTKLESPTRYFFTMVRYLGTFTAPSNPRFDYDGDGKADVSVFRPSDGGWYINNSTNGFSGIQFGISGDKIAPADYDGDGKTDIAVFRSGSWYILQSSNNSFKGVQFGAAEDIPFAGDFDGDDVADINVFRPSIGGWYRLNSTNGQYVGNLFGQNGDIPVSGDFNGDGRDDLAVFRPSVGHWYVARPTGSPAQNFDTFIFGQNGDVPVPSDYDGDGKTDVAVFRPANGAWYILGTQNGFSGQLFGQNGDVPVATDYDGDGKADVAVFRPSNGGWYQMQSTNGFTGQLFGFGTDKPTPGVYLP